MSKDQVIKCDRCGKKINYSRHHLEIAMDRNHPLLKKDMQHGVLIYLSLTAKIDVSNKVGTEWSIEQDLCFDCLKQTVKEIVEDKDVE